MTLITVNLWLCGEMFLSLCLSCSFLSLFLLGKTAKAFRGEMTRCKENYSATAGGGWEYEPVWQDADSLQTSMIGMEKFS